MIRHNHKFVQGIFRLLAVMGKHIQHQFSRPRITE